MLRNILFFLALSSLFLACNEEASSTAAPFKENRFEDAEMRRIHDFQDRQYLDSLAPYFSHEEAQYRREAALACASMQQEPALPFLIDLLEDEDTEVAGAAAYALGQTKDKEAGTALRRAIAIPDSAWARDGGLFYGQVVRALGKIGDTLDLQYVIFQQGELSAAQGVTDLVYAIYQFGLRNIVSREAEEICSDAILDGAEPEAAKLAANYFARHRSLDPVVLHEGVLEDWEMIREPVIRMNIARAFRNLEPEPRRRYTLETALNEQEDYRTRVNAIGAYKPLEDSSALQDLAPLLDHGNAHIAQTAAAVIRKNASASEAESLLERAQSHAHPGVRGELFRAAVSSANKSGDAAQASTAVLEALEEVRTKGAQASNYEIGLLLVALAESPDNTDFLFQQVLDLEDPVQKGYAMIGITIVFSQAGAPPATERLDMLKQALATQDPAVRSLVSYELIRTDAGYKTPDFDPTFIQEALDQIKLPEGIEAYRDLQKTLYALTDDKRPILKRTDYNHPIDWALVSRISQEATAKVQTNKGGITMKLFVEETPATVANFVQLAEEGYFEGKFFHRVVPNFVIQTGCPRGDGWGSLDHSIRSEFPGLHYGTGAVGMASAGKDTESSQFFITHSPTPHLDGRYTVFGKVIEGMDVVHEIEVGDFIEKIELKGIRQMEKKGA